MTISEWKVWAESSGKDLCLMPSLISSRFFYSRPIFGFLWCACDVMLWSLRNLTYSPTMLQHVKCMCMRMQKSEKEIKFVSVKLSDGFFASDLYLCLIVFTAMLCAQFTRLYVTTKPYMTSSGNSKWNNIYGWIYRVFINMNTSLKHNT